MSLSQVFKALEQNEWIDIPKGWLQGRTIYGGLIASMMMHKAVVTIADPEKHLLSTSVTFVGPVQESQARVTAEILRQGKSVTTIEVRLWQDDAVQSILIASFGAQRESAIQVHQERTAPDYAAPETLSMLPRHAAMPQCYEQFDVGWAEGRFPCTGSEKPDFGGWFRFNPEKHENRVFTEADLLALMDIWPPGVLPMFKTLSPASSLTWHVTCVHPVQHQLLDWFKYKVFTDFASDGYATEYAHLWDAENRLIAISRQTVTVFA
ncbi:thioesterase family protein [Acinetobacter chinensis]|uniref:Thioesterase family protein n=1 Tax=Acinetobacter chinensis TaxID=2004650 RepID=A0ABU3WGP1_9GAMM|nr:thioesterase family protein [Acinetobacter chinensis]MDV2469576.1 thioesterase family protein [Acinetobacter chinensis]